jgi:hypothetical protein
MTSARQRPDRAYPECRQVSPIGKEGPSRRCLFLALLRRPRCPLLGPLPGANRKTETYRFWTPSRHRRRRSGNDLTTYIGSSPCRHKWSSAMQTRRRTCRATRRRWLAAAPRRPMPARRLCARGCTVDDEARARKRLEYRPENGIGHPVVRPGQPRAQCQHRAGIEQHPIVEACAEFASGVGGGAAGKAQAKAAAIDIRLVVIGRAEALRLDGRIGLIFPGSTGLFQGNPKLTSEVLCSRDAVTSFGRPTSLI